VDYVDHGYPQPTDLSISDRVLRMIDGIVVEESVTREMPS